MENYIFNNIIDADHITYYNSTYNHQEESVYNITLKALYATEYRRLYNEILKLVKGDVNDANKIMAFGHDLIASKLVLKNNEIGNKCLIDLAHKNIKKLNINIERI